MELWEAKLEIPIANAEEADLLLLESELGEWSLHEDVIVRQAWLIGIFDSESAADLGILALKAALPSVAGDAFTIRKLPDSDWKNSYREHFKAWTFGRLHWVPIWEKDTFKLPEGHQVLWLDTGMAFGTGNHETTRLCIERLVEFERELPAGKAAGLKVIDAGCGSGILALSASLLGFHDVMGFDDDEEAVKVSIENAELNGLVSKVRFKVDGLTTEGLATADVVLANIQSDVLMRNVLPLALSIEPGGMLAMSGILSSEATAVQAAFASETQGWGCDSRILGEWCDVCLRRPS
jgi:ribosomal protein L11 methyltransferase